MSGDTRADRPVTSASGSRHTPGPSWSAAELDIPGKVREPILAVGAETKGVFALAVGSRVWLSREYGRLTVPDNFRAWQRGIAAAESDLGLQPAAVVRDLHPHYVTTAYAEQRGVRVEIVQHHHAHLAACLADNGCAGDVIGLCCDGAGAGPDRASWGCEVLQTNGAEFLRRGHLGYFSLPGGDAAATEPWRPALSLVHATFGPRLPADVERLFGFVPAADLAAARTMLARGVQCPQTSSLGRLFDVAAFVLELGRENAAEGQLARALQAAAEGHTGESATGTCLEEDGVLILDFCPALRRLLERKRAGRAAGLLAADFHETVAALLVEAARRAAETAGLETVALSGGCFVNTLLAGRVESRLGAAGLRVLTHRQVSCGDGGLACGQVYVAASRGARRAPADY